MKNKFIFLLLVLILPTQSIFSEYEPPIAGEDILEFTATQQGGSVTNSVRISDRRGNPSAYAEFEIPVFDITYLAFLEEVGTTPAQLSGHSLTIGFGLPLSAGGFGITGEFHNLSFSQNTAGTSIGLGTSWARTLPGNLSFGVGLRMYIGGENSITDFGIGADIGFQKIHFDIAGISDLTWGLAIRNMGKEYRPISDKTGLEAAFTPAAGIAATLVNTEIIKIRPELNFSFPGFSNFRFDIGSEFTFFSFVTVQLGLALDVAQLSNPNIPAKSIIPRVAVTFSFPFRSNEPMRAENGVITSLSIAPWYDNIIGIGGGVSIPLGVRDMTGPKIDADSSPIILSPNNDGIRDRIERLVSFSDPSGILSYEWTINNSANQVVFTEGRRLVNREVNNLSTLTNYLFTKEEGISDEARIVLNGKDSDGLPLPDGSYDVSLSVVDLRSNTSTIHLAKLLVDTTPPEIYIEPMTQDQKIFSPNNDGNKDTLTIVQTGSYEDLWTIKIESQQGEIVFEKEFAGYQPENFIWDGRNNENEIVPDGVYTYSISAKDKAGNSSQASIQNIIVNSYVSPIRLSISDPAFSPNGDGFRDNIQFYPELTKVSEIVLWNLDVYDGRGSVVRSYEDSSIPPRAIVFDGRDNDQQYLPEGLYRGRLEVLYQSGNKPEVYSGSIEIDVTAPQGLVSKEWSLFSPDSDGNRDDMLFYQEAFTAESRWIGEILDSRGRIIQQFIWEKSVPFQFRWDGTDQDTRIVEDGSYQYRLRAEDSAGNRFVSDPVIFQKDTSEAEYLIIPEYAAFSPNADGIKDTNRFSITQRATSTVTKYTVTIRDNRNGSVRVYSGTGRVPDSLRWDGKNESGGPVADGVYIAELEVIHNNGSIGKAKTTSIKLDTTFPEISLSLNNTIFSPDGDGRKDVFSLSMNSSVEDVFLGQIYSADGVVIREYRWTNQLSDFDWMGRDSTGNIADDGDYYIRVSSEDVAGNRTVAESDLFTLDTRKAAVFITLQENGLAPNGNGLFEKLEFGLFMNITQGLEKWEFEIKNSTDQIVFQQSSDQARERFSITWDGVNEDDTIKEGRYRAFFRAFYEKGDAPTAISQSFILDISGPKQGVELRNIPFSPDGDGVNDELIILLNVQDQSNIAGWQFTITDRTGRIFLEYGASGDVPSELIWDGLSETGERVLAAEDYPYELVTIDQWGNESVQKGIIPVDIFVIKDGDQLKVQIASITFMPNSPELVLDKTSPQGLRNSLILNRLYELFQKYLTYNIRIEGHAVNVTGTDREQEQELIPLSQARSLSVKKALVELGMDSNRIDILGVGGKKPLVPHSDLENRWKNRRVEFILER